jgi:hypothetical protein
LPRRAPAARIVWSRSGCCGWLRSDLRLRLLRRWCGVLGARRRRAVAVARHQHRRELVQHAGRLLQHAAERQPRALAIELRARAEQIVDAVAERLHYGREPRELVGRLAHRLHQHRRVRLRLLQEADVGAQLRVQQPIVQQRRRIVLRVALRADVRQHFA